MNQMDTKDDHVALWLLHVVLLAIAHQINLKSPYDTHLHVHSSIYHKWITSISFNVFKHIIWLCFNAAEAVIYFWKTQSALIGLKDRVEGVL